MHQLRLRGGGGGLPNGELLPRPGLHTLPKKEVVWRRQLRHGRRRRLRGRLRGLRRLRRHGRRRGGDHRLRRLPGPGIKRPRQGYLGLVQGGQASPEGFLGAHDRESRQRISVALVGCQHLVNLDGRGNHLLDDRVAQGARRDLATLRHGCAARKGCA